MIDGVEIKTLVRNPDERGFFEEIIRFNDPFFQGQFGQLSRSNMLDGVVKAWHIHKTQIDWWYCVGGIIKAVLYDTRAESKTYKKIDEYVLGENNLNIVLKIPPQVAHGLKVLKGPADLVYITSSTYSLEEEGRILYNDKNIGYDWVQNKPITNTKIT